MSAAALSIEALRFQWPRGHWRLAVEHLQLHAGERVFLHGRSGCGKSTLLNLIAGTLKPEAGMVEVDGVRADALRGPARDALRADRIGVLFQQFNLLPFLSPVENVLLPCRFSRARRQQAAARFGSPEAAAQALLERLGLPGAFPAGITAATLSVGQQQRVAAARAMIGGPALVIADEPTSALDADARDAFLSLLFAECRAAGSALLFVSHDRALAARFSRSLSFDALTQAGPA